MSEDIRLVSNVAPEGGAEHRTEDLEERLRGDEDRDDVDPRAQRPEVHARGGNPRDRDDAAEDKNHEQDDERDPDPEEGSRLTPGRDLHTWSERGPRYLMTVPRLSPLKGVTSFPARKSTRRISPRGGDRKLHGTARCRCGAGGGSGRACDRGSRPREAVSGHHGRRRHRL